MVVPRLFTWWYRFVCMTCRVEWVRNSKLDHLEHEGQNFIYSLWHSNTATATYLLRGQNLVVLISKSFDGEIAARVLDLLNNEYERGSTSKGGAMAYLKILSRIKKGQRSALTPDGPRGPAHQVQPGCISMAQKAGCPLVPLHIGYSRSRVLTKSWDQHQFPRLFSRILVKVGEPFEVPSKLNPTEFQEVQQQFEQAMMENVSACQAQIETLS